MKNHKSIAKKLEIEDRRKQIRSMLARLKTQQEIADQLNVDRSTISKDIKAIIQGYQKQTNCDLDYLYRQASDKIQEAEKIVWEAYEKLTDAEKKDRYYQTAKVVADLAHIGFTILKDGPALKRINALNKVIEEENNRKFGSE